MLQFGQEVVTLKNKEKAKTKKKNKTKDTLLFIFTAKPIEDDKSYSNVWADVATAEDAPPGGSCRCFWAPNQIRVLSAIQLAVGILCVVFQVKFTLSILIEM